MQLNIMLHKNKKINCFTQPIFTDVDPEKAAIQESRSLQICDLKSALPYKDLDLYFLGVFDDESGKILDTDENGEPLLRKLCAISEVVRSRKDFKDYESSISTDSGETKA